MEQSVAKQSTQPETPDHLNKISNLPPWLLMLFGNYPSSWANEMTGMTLLKFFSDVDEAFITEAVEDYISVSSKWPTIADLRPFLQKVLRDHPQESLIYSMKAMDHKFISKGQVEDGRYAYTFEDKKGKQIYIYY